MTEHPVIDADGHILEGPGFFFEYLPADVAAEAFELLPGSDFDDGVDRMRLAGHTVAMDIAIGDGCTPNGLLAGSPIGRGYDDIHAGAFEAPARLALMDDMGIDVSVLYPSLLLMAQMFDDSTRATIVDAYQRWMSDFCATDPVRLRWVTPVPRVSVDEAVTHVEAAAERGALGAFFSAAPAPGSGRLVGDPAEDPILEALVARDLPLALHVTDGWNSTFDMNRLLPNRLMWDVAAGPIDMMHGLTYVLTSGMLERFPALRVAFLEGNVGWIPYWAHKMHESYEHLGSLYDEPARTPLETLQERCWVSGETDEPGLAEVAALLGPDRCLWATDFPHFEASWKPVDELTGREDLTGADKTAMLCDSSVSFYGLDKATLPTH